VNGEGEREDGQGKKIAMNRPRMGTIFMVLGTTLLIYDSRHEWDTIWATAIGIKLILVAIILLLWDPLKRLNARSDERQRQKDEER
jgi:hypothetical protein